MEFDSMTVREAGCLLFQLRDELRFRASHAATVRTSISTRHRMPKGRLE
jgi:hypothetical protein